MCARGPCFRDGGTTIKINVASLRGWGIGGREENGPQTLFFFGGGGEERHASIIWKVSRSFCLVCMSVVLKLCQDPKNPGNRKTWNPHREVPHERSGDGHARKSSAIDDHL